MLALLNRFPFLRLAEPAADAEFTDGRMVRALVRLRLRWDVPRAR